LKNGLKNLKRNNMGKIPQTKYNADLVVPRAEPKAKYTLKRLNDGLTQVGRHIEWINWGDDNRPNCVYSEPKIGLSLILDPGHDYTWLTTRITEIVEQRDGYIKFQTQNSTYELIES
jgi:hypothetical protein